MVDLGNLWYEAFAGKPLSESTLNLVTKHLDSPNPEIEAMAHSILLLAGSSEQQKTASCRLKSICGQSRFRENPKALALLVSVLEYFPALESPDNRSLVNFVCEAARNAFAPARINAMRVLRRLGKNGHALAIPILNDSLNDPNPYVRQGAETALRLITEPENGP